MRFARQKGLYGRAVMSRLTTSLVIPVKNAEHYLPELFGAVLKQKPFAPDEIILVDSMSTDNTVDAARQLFPEVKIIPIKHFTHGGARNMGARNATKEVIILMTQDATPADEHWLSALLEPLENPKIAAVCSRQLPRPDANPMERFFLSDRFPPCEVVVRSRPADGRAVSVEDVFFSNVSAVVRRDILLQYPFDETLIMSEDQQMSFDVMMAGYSVAYQPKSAVIHSHNYTLEVCFKRYFDSVYSLSVLFDAHGMGKSVSMGAGYIRRELKYMICHAPLWLPYYVLYTSAKVAGVFASHFAGRMPKWMVKKCSLHAYHWDRFDR
ncbi:MAG: glycosyltransferase [Spartobacteria bacterium]|nr:glycosyltransferase [Spartobacteria bacterium]